jgi:hypothetical protein
LLVINHGNGKLQVHDVQIFLVSKKQKHHFRSSPPEPHLLFQLFRLGRAHDLEPALLDPGKFFSWNSQLSTQNQGKLRERERERERERDRERDIYICIYRFIVDITIDNYS